MWSAEPEGSGDQGRRLEPGWFWWVLLGLVFFWGEEKDGFLREDFGEDLFDDFCGVFFFLV